MLCVCRWIRCFWHVALINYSNWYSSDQQYYLNTSNCFNLILLCVINACLLHYFFLAIFLWPLCETVVMQSTYTCVLCQFKVDLSALAFGIGYVCACVCLVCVHVSFVAYIHKYYIIRIICVQSVHHNYTS